MNVHRARFFKTNTLEIFQRMQLRAKPTMYTQELFVHDCCKGKRTKRVHASFVDRFGIFMLAFELEREIIRQMSAFMVSSE